MISYLKIFCLFTLTWSALLVGFNFIVDPIQYYRLDKQPVFLKNMRYQIPGLIKQYDFDTVMVGTSHSANFKPGELDLQMGTRSLNLSANGSSGWEQSKIVALALLTRPVDNVIWEMNYRTVALDATAIAASGVFPLHLYERSFSSHFFYLYSLDTAWQSVKRLLRRGHSDIGTINSWAKKFANRFNGQHVKDHYCSRQAGARFNGRIDDFRPAIANTVIDLASANSNTTFYLFLPPLSYYNYLLAGEQEKFTAFREQIYASTAGHDNIVILDFNTRYDWLGDRHSYKDVEHYSPEISSEMLEIISAREAYPPQPQVLMENKALGSFLDAKLSAEPPCP